MQLLEALQRWRQCPDPLLAAHIDAESAALPSDPVPGRGRLQQERLDQLIEQADPHSLPVILATVFRLPLSIMKSKLARLHEVWPDDPRLNTHYLALLEAPPFTSRAARPLWGLILERLKRSADPRIASLQGRDLAPVFPGESGQLLNRRRANTVDKMAYPEARLPEAERQELEDALHAGAPEQDLTALLQQVLDAPDDHGSRQVYADALLQAGDPRGEYLHLALLDKRNRDQTRRMKTLLAEHESSWLGPLDRVFHKAGRRWEQGFLVAGRLRSKSRGATEAALGSPLWSLVREVELPTVYSETGDRGFELLLQPHSRLTSVHGLESAEELLQVVRRHPQLTHLGLTAPGTEGGWWWEAPEPPSGTSGLQLDSLSLMVQLEDWLPWLTSGHTLRVLQITTVLELEEALRWWPVIETRCSEAWTIDAINVVLHGEVGGPIEVKLDWPVARWAPELLAALPVERVRVRAHPGLRESLGGILRGFDVRWS